MGKNESKLSVNRPNAAFTMIEIALSLGVIAIALVAIIGVLPTGVRVQRDNREDTIINQEGQLLLEAIRSGSRGLDYLTNYFDLITISNVTQTVATNFYNPAGFMPATGGEATLTNGQNIIALLTYPKYTSSQNGNPLRLFNVSHEAVAFLKKMVITRRHVGN